MTVFENVAFGLRVRGASRARVTERVQELLGHVRLEGFAERAPSQLSGGQRQRVALARALAAEPRVLLLDEPFGALDARVRQDLRAWLRRLHTATRVTTVLVTHDREDAFEVADRVAVMNAGRLEQVGPPVDVFHEPASAWVMRFLGDVNEFPVSSPRRVDGRLRPAARDRAVAVPHGRLVAGGQGAARAACRRFRARRVRGRRRVGAARGRARRASLPGAGAARGRRRVPLAQARPRLRGPRLSARAHPRTSAGLMRVGSGIALTRRGSRPSSPTGRRGPRRRRRSA